jgi:Bacterial Alpha-2-macroglobulin MG10 domain
MIAVYQKDARQSAEWKKFAILPTNQERTSLSMYLNQPRGLLAKADALLADQAATQTERMDALSQLISSRNAQGTRGMDAVNAQALWTITRIAPDAWTRKDPVSCTVTIDGKSQKVTVTKTGLTITQPTTNTKDVIAEFTCDNTLIADTSITYVPEKLTDLLGADKHVTQMNYSIGDPTVAIGDTTKLAASWTTTLAAQNAVISIYIPSTYKFLNTIKTKNPTQQPNGMMDYMGPTLPFDLSDSHCTPTHRETRYDQLYLYYDTLPAVTCDITIPLLKAYNGNAVIMPMTVSEMYKGNVNGRKVVIQKAGK